MNAPEQVDLSKYLDGVRYPCQRDELLQTAAAQGASDGVLGQIGKLPEQDYADIDGVTRALYGEF
jgi:hypothetical protein